MTAQQERIDDLCQRASRMLFGRPRRIAASIPLLEEASRMGSPWAQGVLADVLMERSTKRSDLLRAAELLRSAALAGDASAALNLGIMHGQGRGVPRDSLEAMRWFRLAARRGNGRACYNLRLYYDTGILGKTSPRQALGWYRRAGYGCEFVRSAARTVAVNPARKRRHKLRYKLPRAVVG